MILILQKNKVHFRENWLIFFGIWGEAELFLGIWGAKANTLRETRTLFGRRRGDHCIIFRDQGSTDAAGGGGAHCFHFGKSIFPGYCILGPERQEI